MTIEFYCKQCYQKVETPDSTAGKKGRCPHCGQIAMIPLASEAPPTQSQPQQPMHQVPMQPLVRAAQTTPVPVPKPSAEPGWGTQSSKLKAASRAREIARSSLAAPATGLIISGMVTLLSAIIAAGGLILYLSTTVGADEPNYVGVVIGLTLIGLNVAIPTIVITGANHARLAKNYTTAVTGSIIALLPFTWCSPLSFPFGLWTLMVLLRADVRSGFGSM